MRHKAKIIGVHIRPELHTEAKTVLTRIISIVRVPSLCFYKDTHNSSDDELECSSLSVKLEMRSAEMQRAPH